MSSDHLISLGMHPDDAASRVGLVTAVARRFAEIAGAPPAWCWFVPGRIEVFGKHTDYAGGRSLLAAVPRGFGVAARPRDDGRVRVVDVRHGVRVEIDPGEAGETHRGWASYVHVVVRRFARNFPGARLGADIALASDLPRAAGMSSSSALVVGVATALARCADLAAHPEWMAQIGGIEDLAWYLGCVENGLDYRGLPGTAGVGTHGGSEDHTAILTCRADHLSQYGFVPVTHHGDVVMPAEWTFVVASSGVHADKAGGVKEQYNRASLACRALLACWNGQARTPARSLGDVVRDPVCAGQLRALVRSVPMAGFTAPELLRRLDHFVAEDARVPGAAQAFAATDAAALGALADESQRHADEWLGNQVRETRVLAALAREHGALAASSFGAGFGGSVWAVVSTEEAERFGSAWMRAYASEIPARAGAEWFVARPGPALTEVPLDSGL